MGVRYVLSIGQGLDMLCPVDGLLICFVYYVGLRYVMSIVWGLDM